MTSTAVDLPAAHARDEFDAIRRLAAELATRGPHSLAAERTTPEALRASAQACAAQIAERVPALASEARELERLQCAFLDEHAERLAQRNELEVDAAAELAARALDLTVAERGDLAERLLSAYAGEANDFELYGVIDFHERQCALERAAEACDGAEQRDDLEADVRRWLLLGLSTERRPVIPPMLVAVGGLVASGKSTVSRIIADRMAVPRIEADRAVHDLSGCDEVHVFTRSFESDVYDEVVRRAEIVLASGRSIVLDGCFSRRRQRDAARNLAREHGWPFLFVECRVDPETARARIEERNARDPHGGWEELYEELRSHWEAPRLFGAGEHLVLDCAQSIDATAAELARYVPGIPEGHALP